jgi:hypothetical protein
LSSDAGVLLRFIPSIGGTFVMPIQGVMFFQMGARGWTEKVWLTTSSLTSAISEMSLLAPVRAQMLSNGAFLTGYRVSNDDFTRDSLSDVLPAGNQQGALPRPILNWADSDPDDALVLHCSTANPQVQRPYLLRGITSYIFGPGYIFAPTPTFLAALTTWETMMFNGAYGIRGFNRGVAPNPPIVPPVPIVNMALETIAGQATGRVEIITSLVVATGDRVIIRGGNRVKGLEGNHTVLGLVPAVPPAVVSPGFYVRSLSSVPNYIGGGTVQKVVYEVDAFTYVQSRRLSSRKSGRPFGVPRGRRSIVRY